MNNAPKKEGRNWNAIASIGTIISSITAVVAIFIGIFQFNKSIDKTDKQIELIQQETQSRFEENKPLITINKNFVAGLKGNKQFKLVIENIGTRPAYDVYLRSIVISANSDFSDSIIAAESTFSFSNPLNKGQEIEFFGNIPLKKTIYYFIKIKIDFFDNNTKSKQALSQEFYFKWTDIKDKDYRNDVLYGVDLKDKNKIDQLINNN